jgi:hypothetical protein
MAAGRTTGVLDGAGLAATRSCGSWQCWHWPRRIDMGRKKTEEFPRFEAALREIAAECAAEETAAVHPNKVDCCPTATLDLGVAAVLEDEDLVEDDEPEPEPVDMAVSVVSPDVLAAALAADALPIVFITDPEVSTIEDGSTAAIGVFVRDKPYADLRNYVQTASQAIDDRDLIISQLEERIAKLERQQLDRIPELAEAVKDLAAQQKAAAAPVAAPQHKKRGTFLRNQHGDVTGLEIENVENKS